MVDFDLTPFVEAGGDYASVCLWKISFGHPSNTEHNANDYVYVLALTAEHAIKIVEQWQRGTDLNQEPEPIIAMAGITSNILTDSRFVCESGYVECPKEDGNAL